MLLPSHAIEARMLRQLSKRTSVTREERGRVQREEVDAVARFVCEKEAAWSKAFVDKACRTFNLVDSTPTAVSISSGSSLTMNSLVFAERESFNDCECPSFGDALG